MRNKSIKKRNKNMAQPKTLSELVGLDGTPCSLSESALIMVDFQNTYRSGPMELAGVDGAMAEAEQVLARARSAGTPVIHIAHDAGSGSLYDVQAENGIVVDQSQNITSTQSEKQVECAFCTIANGPETVPKFGVGLE